MTWLMGSALLGESVPMRDLRGREMAHMHRNVPIRNARTSRAHSNKHTHYGATAE
jgi:hypothetical protein